jgi:hypothetical protein
MHEDGRLIATVGVAAEKELPLMVQLALAAAARQEGRLLSLPSCQGEFTAWVCQVAENLRQGRCQRALLFCRQDVVAACLANKLPGVRAAAVRSLAQARQALEQLGANLLIVEPAACTYFECRQLLQWCRQANPCPEGLARWLRELETARLREKVSCA